jgi:hypothetical protein
MSYVLTFSAALPGLFRCNPEAVAAYSQALADIVSQYDLPAFWVGLAKFFQGWAKRSDGAEEPRLVEMRRGLAIFLEPGVVNILPILGAALAEAEASAGEILLKRDPVDTVAAEQSLQVAIAIAQSQKARSFELRAALSLAKRCRSTGRDADAHAVLAPAVDGFPPTQQFPELAEVQALLAMLGP